MQFVYEPCYIMDFSHAFQALICECADLGLISHPPFKGLGIDGSQRRKVRDSDRGGERDTRTVNGQDVHAMREVSVSMGFFEIVKKETATEWGLCIWRSTLRGDH